MLWGLSLKPNQCSKLSLSKALIHSVSRKRDVMPWNVVQSNFGAIKNVKSGSYDSFSGAKRKYLRRPKRTMEPFFST